MLTFKAAHELLARHVGPLAPATRRVTDVVGCRLAGEVSAVTDWPIGNVSTMDGYAARTSDTTDRESLPIAFEVPAGQTPSALPPGACARIFTGALLPSGADVVIPEEHAECAGERVRLPTLDAGNFIRPRGEVCHVGDVLGSSGNVVTPQLLGLLVAAGPIEISVWSRPRVGILTTGSELLAPDAELVPGRIRDSNGPMLAALAVQAGLSVTCVDRAEDTLEHIAHRLEVICASSDFVVTNGGVSVGKYDLLPQAIEFLSGELLFHRVAIRPGKPILVARLGSTWLIGLPGNPVSAFVGWHAFVRPLAERLAGATQVVDPPTIAARITEPVENPGVRMVLSPVRLEDGCEGCTAAPLRWKGSHDIVALARANGLLLIDSGQQRDAGATMECLDLRLSCVRGAHARQAQPSR